MVYAPYHRTHRPSPSTSNTTSTSQVNPLASLFATHTHQTITSSMSSTARTPADRPASHIFWIRLLATLILPCTRVAS